MNQGAEALPRLKHSNLSDTVYDTLCDALLKGHFKPGDRLKIRELAETLNTSVTPVRDAILHLQHDEAVVFHSARNIRVAVLTSKKYQEIREIRLRLETLSAEKAARNGAAPDIAEMKRILAENEEAITSGNGARGAELNQRFHFKLVEMAELSVLDGILKRLWMQSGPLIAQGYLEGGRHMIDHHYDILDAIERKDSEAAASAIRRDLLDGGAPLIALLERQEMEKREHRNDTPGFSSLQPRRSAGFLST